MHPMAAVSNTIAFTVSAFTQVNALTVNAIDGIETESESDLSYRHYVASESPRYCGYFIPLVFPIPNKKAMI